MNMFVLIIILLLIGFVLLVFFCGCWFENVLVIVGVGFVGLVVLVIVFIGVDFLLMVSRYIVSCCGCGCW